MACVTSDTVGAAPLSALRSFPSKRAGAKRGSEPGHDGSTEGACTGRRGVRLQGLVQCEQGFEEQLSGERL